MILSLGFGNTISAFQKSKIEKKRKNRKTIEFIVPVLSLFLSYFFSVFFRIFPIFFAISFNFF